MTEKLNPFKIAQQQLDEAAAILKLEPGIHALLREPRRELHVTIPVKMDDGTVKQFTPAPGKTVMVDGVLTTYETLKVGTVLTADFVKTTTTVPVETTKINNGTLLKVAGNTIIVRHSDGD